MASAGDQGAAVPYIDDDVVLAAVKAVGSLPSLPKVVALEFGVPPADTLWFVRALREALRETLGEGAAMPRLCVLHDSRCCPGAVAARKIEAGVLLHFGPCCGCCSAPGSDEAAGLPCPLVVLPSPFVAYDGAAVARQVAEAVEDAHSQLDAASSVVVALDAELASHAAQLEAAAFPTKPAYQVVFCQQAMCTTAPPAAAPEGGEMLAFAGWALPRSTVSTGGLVYVGTSSSAALAMEASVPAAAFRAVLLPATSGGESESEAAGSEEARAMLVRGRAALAMRRSKALDAARSSTSFGLLVASPLHARTARALADLVAAAPAPDDSDDDSAKRTAYLVEMGSVDEYRVANFPDTQMAVAVVVACPYTLTFLDGRRFDRPVVSAAELVLALADDSDWVTHYTTDAAAALAAHSHATA